MRLYLDLRHSPADMLRGSVLRYEDPTAAHGQNDWDAAN